MHENSSTKLVDVAQVASWQIPKLRPDGLSLHAALPSLQRGAVWAPKQVEILWDSLIRGFPIGSFLLTPYDRNYGTQSFLYQSKDKAEPHSPQYHLLDGQQRCNSIAVGFLNHWDHDMPTKPDLAERAALWVDLAKGEDERRFIFRLVTRSHPWGYRRDDPSKRLEANQRRDAMSAYQAVSLPQFNNRPEFPLRSVWPWDAVAPIPVVFIIEAVTTGSGWKGVRERLKLLPYWQHSENLVTRHSSKEEGDWRARVAALLDRPPDGLLAGFSRLLGEPGKDPSYHIPAIVLSDSVTVTEKEKANESKESEGVIHQDPIATLFVRVNSGGTPLTGEELMYSILKSIWPDAQSLVENLSSRFMPPSRLVTLVSRLIVARSNPKEPPAAPDVTRYRRLIRGTDQQCPQFLDQMKEFLKHDELFYAAKGLLVGNPLEPDHRLPAVLAAELARHAPDAFFLFLAWIDRMKTGNQDCFKLDVDAKRRLVGALSALGWFSSSSTDCLRSIWKRLQQTDPIGLPDFWSNGILRCCLEPSENGDIQLPLLPPPAMVRAAIENSIFQAAGFDPPDDDLLRKWTWWEQFKTFKGKKELKEWYDAAAASSSWHEEQRSTHTERSWGAFTDALWGKRELVLFAQRMFILSWYPNHDPSNPDQVEDHGLPWDIDHIHPQKFVYYRQKVPGIIKEWHGSIGNLRVWPMEANRGDGDVPPSSKLGAPDSFMVKLGLKTEKDIRDASFIRDEIKHWIASTPEGDDFRGNYLASSDSFLFRKALTKAITSRFVALYKEWYDTLLIKDLVT